MRIRRASQFMPSRAALAHTRTAWLTMFQDHSVRDLANGLGGAGVFPMGSTRIETDEGPALSFNGTTNGTAGIVGSLPPIDRLAFIARVRSTGAQPGNPGAAFGVYASTAQGGLGIGFNGNNVGAAWLTSAGAGTAATVPTVQGQWYTVIVQGSPISIATTAAATWVDGSPAVRGGTSSGAVNGPLNEVVIGAQHASSGYLRRFRGDVLWAAILVGDSPNWMTDEIAARLVADDYPYNLRRDRESPVWLSSGGVPPEAYGGVLRMRGNAPAATQTHKATAPGGVLAQRGNAPTATQLHKATAPGARLEMRGAGVSAEQTHKATAAGGVLRMRGNWPTATGTGDLVAAAGRLVMRGNAPAAVQTHKATAPGGALRLRGAAVPVVQTHKATAPGAILTQRGNWPEAHTAGALVPGLGRLVMRGNAPAAKQTHAAQAYGGVLRMRGNWPAVIPAEGLGEVCDPTTISWQDAYRAIASTPYSYTICGYNKC